MIEYVHISEDEEIETSGGYYQVKEKLLDYKGKDILCIRSEARGPISLCCGCGYVTAGSIFVKGRVVEWKTKNEAGDLVSKLETIEGTKEQQDIRKILEAEYNTSSINF